jgi:carbon monoxide dehydrogenase subunit G
VASSVHASIVINRAIEEVFAVLTNVENNGKWFPGDVKGGTSRNAPFEVMLTFERVEGGTRIESDIDMLMRGPARLLGGFFTRWYGKSWEQGIRNLKRMMEAGEL